MNANKESLCQLTQFVLENSAFPAQVKRSLIKDYILWKWTAGFNDETKFLGCRFWSKRAFEQWQLTRKKFKSGKFSKGKIDGLRHDHVAPRAFVFDKLKDDSKDTTSKILELFSVGCVLTFEENQHLNDGILKDAMPEGRNNVWDRYPIAFKGVGITIFEVSWPNAKVIKTILDVPQNES